MKKGKVLIAEDDPVALEVLIYDFEDAGYEVLPFLDGSQVVEMAIKHLPDLIVLDLIMPIVDGYAIAGQLKGRPETTHIPIIIVSSKETMYVDETTAQRQDVVLNCVERLEKPVDMPYLLNKSDKYIHAGRAIKSLSQMQKKVESI